MGFIAAIKNRFKKAKPKKQPDFNEVAISELYGIFANGKESFTKYNPSDLMSRKGVEIIDQMRRDDQIKAAMYFKKSVVMANGWEIVSPVDEGEDWDVSLFVHDVLLSIDGTLERKIFEILTAMEYGHSVTEMIWSKDSDKIILSGLKTKYPHDITYNTDGFGNITSINQNNNPLPMEKFVTYAYDKEFDNPYGKSDLESAYRAWWTKNNTYKWMAMLLERMGIPPIFAMYDNDAYTPDALSRLQDVISNFQAGTVGVLPRPERDSLEMWTPQIANNIGDVFIPALNMMNKDIARALLMPGLIGMTPDEGAGSNARSRTHLDVLFQVAERIRHDLEQHVINEQIIKPLVDYNFNVTSYPMFRFLPIDNQSRTRIISRWEGLTEKGVVRSTYEDELHVRKMLDFPDRERDEIDDELDDKELAAAKIRDVQPVASTISPKKEDDGSEPALNKNPKAKKKTKRASDSDSAGSDSDPEESGGEEKDEGSDEDSEFAIKADENINFKQIEKTLDDVESSLHEQVVAQLKLSLDDLEKSIKRTDNLDKFAEELNLRRFKKIHTILKTDLKAALIQGYDDASREFDGVQKFAEGQPGFILTRAVKWLLLKVGLIANSLKSKIEADATQVIIEGIRTGALLPKIIDNLRKVYEPYVGDDKILKDKDILSPYRLETMIRTNSTQAYNQGRLVMFRENEELLAGVRYSAILDGRTTEVCRTLNNKVFRVSDPMLDKLAPANHYNCRSLLVPVTIGRPVNQDQIVTPELAGEALGLAGEFAGER